MKDDRLIFWGPDRNADPTHAASSGLSSPASMLAVLRQALGQADLGADTVFMIAEDGPEVRYAVPYWDGTDPQRLLRVVHHFNARCASAGQGRSAVVLWPQRYEAALLAKVRRTTSAGRTSDD